MLQLKGLMKKDWKLIKGYVLLALLLDFVIPFGAALLYPMEFLEGAVVFAGTIMALHLLLPMLFLAILFTKELDRPDIFFHSTASIHKINASKFMIAFAGTIASFLWIGFIGVSIAWLSPQLTSPLELMSIGAYFSISMLFVSIESVIIFYFFMVLFFIMKPKIGGFAYIVTTGLFFFSLELWSRFQATVLFQKVTGFWVIRLEDAEPFPDFDSAAFFADVDLTLSLGKFFVLSILLVFLYLLSAYWFEKKVRV